MSCLSFRWSLWWQLLAASSLIGSLPALAGGWQQSVSLPLTLEYDSNPTMSPTLKTELWRAKAAPSYSLMGSYGADEFKAGLGLQVEQPSDKKISSSRQDPNLSLGWRRQTETGEYGLAAKYDQASTQSSALTESGLIVRDGTRTTKSLLGNWRSTVSERSSLAADADYKTAAYDGGALIGFSNLSAGITFSHAWSERIEPYLRVAASRYVPDSTAAASSNNYTTTVGVKLKSSENLDWSAEAGKIKIAGQMNNTSWQGNLKMHYLGSRSDIALYVGRSVAASGEGGFVQSDQVKGAWSYAFDALTRAGLDASRQNSKGLTPNTMLLRGAWVSHELSPFWSSRLSYQHKQRQQSGQADASAHVLGVTLVFTHPNF